MYSQLPWCEDCHALLWASVQPHPIQLSFSSVGTALLPFHLPQVSAAMHAIKFGGRHDLALHLGQFMARNLDCPQIDVLVPLPLRADRRYLRGYNQAERIAQGLSSVWNVPLAHNWIQRPLSLQNIGSRSQASRSESDRIGIYGAYHIPQPETFRQMRAALVDDTITTGSTLNAAAEVIQKKTRVADLIPLTLAYAVRGRT